MADASIGADDRVPSATLLRGTVGYPSLLAQCPDAPEKLRIRGALAPADERAVAVVGTRAMTAYGERVARDIATDLALAGITVLSGLAHGIDEVAHRAALEAGGRTLAVLGCGLDAFAGSISRRRLFDGIVQRGAVISEHPDDTQAAEWTFPRRNRIIAGLALATVVVEAGAPSGALITAARALDYDRAVLAVPGSLYSPKAAGCHRLIHEGRARLCRGGADVLAELGVLLGPTRVDTLPLAAAERAVLSAVRADARHVDDVSRELGRPVEEVAALLTLLELRDLVRSLGDGRWVAARR